MPLKKKSMCNLSIDKICCSLTPKGVGVRRQEILFYSTCFHQAVFPQVGYIHSLGFISFSEKGAGDLWGISLPSPHSQLMCLTSSSWCEDYEVQLQPWGLNSAECWAPNQKCVRMARGWSLVCWGSGFESRSPGCLSGAEQGRDGSKSMPTPQRAELWPYMFL